MRLQQVLTVSGLMAMGYASVGYAFPDVDENDIPKHCWRVCGKVVGMSHKCEGQFHDNDRGQQNCMCNWHGASKLIPLCEACVSKYESGNGDRRYPHDRDHDHDHDHDDDDSDDDDDDDRDHDRRVKRGNSPHDNDVYDIVTACNFSTTTYGAEATTAMTMATSTMTGASATGTGSSSSGTSGSGTSGGSSSSTVDESGSSSDSSTPTNGAAATAMPMTASVAAIGSLMALAWL